jgi:hypothetical protein
LPTLSVLTFVEWVLLDWSLFVYKITYCLSGGELDYTWIP